MGFFPDTIAAQMAGNTVIVAPVGLFDFEDQPMRVWPGYGTLTAGGYDWSGLGEFGSVTGLEQAIGDALSQPTFTLSGLDASMISLAVQSENKVKGRDITVYVQFFAMQPGDGGMGIVTPLDNPYAFWLGEMDVMTYVQTGPNLFQVELTCINENADRRRPAFGLVTYADQIARFAGDTSFRYTGALRARSLPIPW